MAEIHDIIRELRGKKEPEKNLKSYAELIRRDACVFSWVSFAFQYIALLEELYSAEDGQEKTADVCLPEFLKLSVRLNEYTEQLLSGEKTGFSEVEKLRCENTGLMERLTAETDLFSLCEYIMNRMEHEFEGEKTLPEDYSDLSMTDEIMRYIGLQKEEGQNLAIQLLIEQLPVRMTKNRFYEAVSERLSIYRNSDRAAFENILKVVRSVSGLLPVSDEDAVGNSLSSIYEEFRDPETSELSEFRYRDLKTELIADAASLNVNMDLGQTLQEALNAFTLLMLSESEETFESETVSREIVKSVLSMMTEEKTDALEEVYERCEELEGIMEEALGKLTADLSSFDWIREKYADLLLGSELSEAFNDLKRISLLTSDSTFAALSKENNNDEVTDEMFRTEVLALLQEFSTVFSGASRRFVRAVTALVNGELPPRFTSQEELENYIYSALSGCSNISEKLGVLDLIFDIMNQ